MRLLAIALAVFFTAGVLFAKNNGTNQSAAGNNTSSGNETGNESGAGSAENASENENATPESNTTGQSAGNATPGNVTEGTPESSSRTMELTVKKVDEDNQTITGTESGGKEVEFSTAGVSITDDAGNQQQLSDIKEGRKINLTYTGSETSPTVSKIEIQPEE